MHDSILSRSHLTFIYFGCFGNKGAGKTTTCGILSGEIRPTSGDVLVSGRIGYCPQFNGLFDHLTGREHVELYASIKGLKSKFLKEAVDHKLSEVGLSEKDSDRLSSNYSGGMKRKLSIACATIGQPYVIFDEPTTGVDPVARRQIWQVISDLTSTTNPYTNEKTCAILTTHSMDECEALCSRIGILANGSLICLGSAQRLKSKFGRGYQLDFKVRGIEQDDNDFVEMSRQLALHHPSSFDMEEMASAGNVSFNLEQTEAVLSAVTGDAYLPSMITAENLAGSCIFKEASSLHGVSLPALAGFATLELRMRNLDGFIRAKFNGVLRERQDTKCRYEIGSNDVILAYVFAAIELNKTALHLSEYGVSQTSLEQVFNTLVSSSSAGASNGEVFFDNKSGLGTVC